jgi:hypothetical protein
MKLIRWIQGLFWLSFLQILVAFLFVAPLAFPYPHVAIGLAIAALAYSVFRGILQTRAPGRMKILAASTFFISVVMILLGALLLFQVGAGWSLPRVPGTVNDLILVLHVALAFAILTHAGALFLAYDMWEGHDFEIETSPGRIVPGLSSPDTPTTRETTPRG